MRHKACANVSDATRVFAFVKYMWPEFECTIDNVEKMAEGVFNVQCQSSDEEEHEVSVVLSPTGKIFVGPPPILLNPSTRLG